MNLEEINAYATIGAVIVAGIGAIATFATIFIKGRLDRQRELLGWAMQAALKDFEISKNLESLKPIEQEKNKKGDKELLIQEKDKIISSYLYFHYHWLQKIDSGKANKETLISLTNESLVLVKASKNAHARSAQS